MLSVINQTYHHFDQKYIYDWFDIIEPPKIKKCENIGILLKERYITIQNSRIIRGKSPSIQIRSILSNNLEKVENYYRFDNANVVEIKVYDEKYHTNLFYFVVSSEEAEYCRFKILASFENSYEVIVEKQIISGTTYHSNPDIQKTPANILQQYLEHHHGEIDDLDRYRNVSIAIELTNLYRNDKGRLKVIHEIYYRANNLVLDQERDIVKCMHVDREAKAKEIKKLSECIDLMVYITEMNALSPYDYLVKHKKSYNHECCFKNRKNLVREYYQRLSDNIYKHVTYCTGNSKDEVIAVEYVYQNKKVSIQINSLNEQSIDIECDDSLFGAELTNKYLSKKNLKGVYGYKIAETMDDQKCLVTLMILPESKIATDGRKYRTNLAIVHSINIIEDSYVTDQVVDKAKSFIYCADFYYRRGEKIEVRDFDGTLNEVCKQGIHYFYTIAECSEYLGTEIKCRGENLDEILYEIITLYDNHVNAKPDSQTYHDAKDRFENNNYN